MSLQFAQRLSNVETSVIRELFKVMGQPDIINFAGGVPDSALFDVEGIRAAADRALASDRAALQYGSTEGYNPLREQLVQLMQDKGVHDLLHHQLVVTTGSQQALDLLGKVLIDPDSKVIVESPTFLATIQCFRLYGAQLIGAPIDADGIKVQELEALIQAHRPRLVYLIPTYGNPSGATLTLERRKRVLELAVQYQTLIVEDDPYGDLYFDAPPPPSLLALSYEVPGARDWLVHCGSLSKVLSPGLRLGWLIGPESVLSQAAMCKQFSDAHTSTFAQATAAQYLQTDRLPSAIAKVCQAYGVRAKYMCEAMRRELGDRIEFVVPQGGMFVWARLTGVWGGMVDSQVLARRAIDLGVAFVPGAPFYCEAPDTATLRLSFATSNEAAILEGMARLGKALG